MTDMTSDDLEPLTPEPIAWMQQLNAEAVQRRIPDWPKPHLEVNPSDWLEDFHAGLTPADALTRAGYVE